MCGLVLIEPCTGEEKTSPVYPWKTLSFEAFARSSFLKIPGDEGTGGEFIGGLSISPMGIKRGELLLSGGYRYMEKTGKPPGGMFSVGTGFGYHLTLAKLFGFVPAAGINLSIPVYEGSGDIFTELILETTMRIHLHSRNFLRLHTGVGLPLGSRGAELPEGPVFSIGFGIEKAHPVMLPLDRLNTRLSLTPYLFSPDGDGRGDTLRLSITTKHAEAIDSWTMRVYDQRNTLFFKKTGKNAPPDPITWNGRSEEGELVSSAGTYTVEFSVTDVLGRTELHREAVLIDILIIREDGKLKIRIPHITFPAESADFALLSEEKDIEKNREVLQRLSVIFSAFPEYSILIEGHANMEHYADPDMAEREQEEVLIPLSRERAQSVKEALVELGIRPDRISVSGLGARSPLVPFSDSLNRWKNRRVEFILVKPSSPGEGAKNTQ